jgi:hypothetical protein
MQVYALTSSQSVHETLDLFLTREAAEAELREILEGNLRALGTCFVPFRLLRTLRS